MAEWLVATYVAVMLSLITAAGFVALFFREPARRKDAYKVLRLLITAGAATGVVGLLVKLHELGLLR